MGGEAGHFQLPGLLNGSGAPTTSLRAILR
jgi:hypothetical protein